ncbi:MAG: ribokinase [Clostridia bacterium]|nr:ribokinase [Clostridia bacterium]
MKNILVIGSINVDYVIHTERLPKLGETLTGSDFAMNFGGKGANQAMALAKTGCNVKMLGAVGKDLSGELAINNLKSFGIDTTDVITVDAPTGAAVITVCGGDNHIILDIGANAYVTPDAIAEREALFDWADYVVMQYEIPMESVLFAARMTKKHGKKVVLNPAPVKEADPELFRFVDMIIPNEFEAQLITGISPNDEATTKQAIRALQALGCETVIITLGKRGCAYTEGDSIGTAGIYPVKVVDTTAAGDSFIGGLCKSLCEGKSMSDAVAYASAVSSITVSRPGAGISIPTADEVEDFLKKI